MLPVKQKREMEIRDDDVIDIGVDGDIDTTNPDKQTYEELKGVIGDIRGFNKSSQMKDIVEDIRLEKKKAKFHNKISTVLQNICRLHLEDENQLQTLFLFVLQSAEDYIHSKETDKCDKIKMDLCIGLLKQFVQDDERLCKQIISIVAPRIKKSTFWRRNKISIMNGVGFFLVTACNHS